ncbi:MAG: uroporphyrinogen-III synthase [Alphaproteobacteria bacterium]|nr:uroporphyrinogen-III synthase [Alphaproteobacteria bacterium]
MRPDHTILLVRPRPQSDEYAAELRDLGYDVLIDPMLEIKFLDRPFPSISDYGAVIATSMHGIKAFAEATDNRDIPLCVVGEKSKRYAEELGFGMVTCGGANAKALADVIGRDFANNNTKLLYVRAEDVAFNMVEALASYDIQVDEYVAYKAEKARALSAAVKDALREKAVAAVPFFSVRSAEAFFECAEDAKLTPFPGGIKALCISESVLEYVRSKSGLEAYVAETPSRSGLTALVTAHCQTTGIV